MRFNQNGAAEDIYLNIDYLQTANMISFLDLSSHFR